MMGRFCRSGGLRLRVTKEWKTAWAMNPADGGTESYDGVGVMVEVMVGVPGVDQFVEALVFNLPSGMTPPKAGTWSLDILSHI